MTDSSFNIMATDTTLGGDGYIPGIAQPVTVSEIRDIISSPRPSIERRHKLMTLRRDLSARDRADIESGTGGLLSEIDRGLSILSGAPAGTAHPDVLSR